jgi:hypothetical protein
MTWSIVIQVAIFANRVGSSGDRDCPKNCVNKTRAPIIKVKLNHSGKRRKNLLEVLRTANPIHTC